MRKCADVGRNSQAVFDERDPTSTTIQGGRSVNLRYHASVMKTFDTPGISIGNA
jgi:hypothetical protein